MFMFRRLLRLRGMRDGKSKIAWSVFLTLFIYIAIDNCGVVEVIFEKDFRTEFTYPLNLNPNDFQRLVHQFRNGEQVEYQPINKNFSVVDFNEQAITNCNNKNPIGLLILVKSAPFYFQKRKAIRETWGHSQYLQNISQSIGKNSPLISCFSKNHSEDQDSKFSIKLVFLLGNTEIPDNSINRDNKVAAVDISADGTNKENKDNSKFSSVNNQNEKLLSNEILKHDDIVRADFVDSYENNTFKMMVGLRWAVDICSNFRFAFLVDDDMYISVNNLIKFLENLQKYPNLDNSPSVNENDCSSLDGIYAGKVLNSVRPIRYKIGTKWYLSLDEYPYNEFPPYLPAASILMSKSVAEDFYYSSYFTKNFRFDDIYLGILAHKMNITPFNSDYFHVCHTQDGNCFPGNGLKYVIARHGLKSTEELRELWATRKQYKSHECI